jgi:hypothetical protein
MFMESVYVYGKNYVHGKCEYVYGKKYVHGTYVFIGSVSLWEELCSWDV